MAKDMSKTAGKGDGRRRKPTAMGDASASKPARGDGRRKRASHEASAQPAIGGSRRKATEAPTSGEELQQRKEGYMRQLREAVERSETSGAAAGSIAVPRIPAGLKEHFSAEELDEIKQLRERALGVRGASTAAPEVLPEHPMDQILTPVTGKGAAQPSSEAMLSSKHAEGTDRLAAPSSEINITEERMEVQPDLSTAPRGVSAGRWGEHMHEGEVSAGKTTSPETVEPKSLLTYLSEKYEKRIFSAGHDTILAAGSATPEIHAKLDQVIGDLILKVRGFPSFGRLSWRPAFTFHELIGLQAHIFGAGRRVIALDVLAFPEEKTVRFENLGRVVMAVDPETGLAVEVLDNYDATAVPVSVSRAPISIALLELVHQVSTLPLVASGSHGKSSMDWILDIHPDLGHDYNPAEYYKAIPWVSVLDQVHPSHGSEGEFEVIFAQSNPLVAPKARNEVDVLESKRYQLSDIYQAVLDIVAHMGKREDWVKIAEQQ